MKQCPSCGGTKFYVTAHIVQGWSVNGFGDYEETTEDCIEVAHYPDDDDLWTCASCGFEDAGKVFNV